MTVHTQFRKHLLSLMLALAAAFILAACNQPSLRAVSTGVDKKTTQCDCASRFTRAELTALTA